MQSPTLIGGELVATLIAEASQTGGWSYYSGKSSRIEPTCWAMLALANGDVAVGDVHPQFLAGCQRSDGLFSDRPDLPSNLSWSALAFLTLSTLSTSLLTTRLGERLLEAIVKTAGVQLRNSPLFRQDNTLHGWPWMPETFSWVEPTSWCLLALKRALLTSLGQKSPRVLRRIAEGEAVLIDRACDSGGWNYGNAQVLGTNLPAHIPTTALGLIALQDKPDLPVVRRSLTFIEEHWRRELSGTALSLSLICLRTYGRPTDELEAAVVDQWQRTRFLGNLATISMAACALDVHSGATAALTLS